MTSLYQALLSHGASGHALRARDVSPFTAPEIRQTIAQLVGDDRMQLADSLCAAGLSLYPESEDILAISALLAEINQDWAQAQTLLTELINQQGDGATPLTWRHLIRVLRCQCEPGLALDAARRALVAHPGDAHLHDELQTLQALVSSQVPVVASNFLH
jgi:hypothetical protein